MALVGPLPKLKSQSRFIPGSRELKEGLSRTHSGSKLVPDGSSIAPMWAQNFHTSCARLCNKPVQVDSLPSKWGSGTRSEPRLPVALMGTLETD